MVFFSCLLVAYLMFNACEFQQFKPGYTAPPPLFQFGDIPMNFRGNWEISRRDLNNPRFIAVVSTNRNFLDPAYEEYSASTSRSLMCCHSVALILESIGALEQFMLKHRKDYVDVHRTTEQERDSIEHEVGAFIKACKEQIDILKNSINDEVANSKGWLGNRGDTNADTVTHKHGVSRLCRH